MIDFPNNPAINDIFTSSNRSWKWDGVAWRSYAPPLAAVATSGDYIDLSNKPTIPTQVNSDWNATTGTAQILNKPTLGTAAATNASAYATAAQGAKADTASQPGHTHAISDVTNLSTTLDNKIGKNSSDVSPVSTIRCMTQTEYDALGSYDSQTIYFIK